jgi:hypothetical protein
MGSFATFSLEKKGESCVSGYGAKAVRSCVLGVRPVASAIK